MTYSGGSMNHRRRATDGLKSLIQANSEYLFFVTAIAIVCCMVVIIEEGILRSFFSALGL